MQSLHNNKYPEQYCQCLKNTIHSSRWKSRPYHDIYTHSNCLPSLASTRHWENYSVCCTCCTGQQVPKNWGATPPPTRSFTSALVLRSERRPGERGTKRREDGGVRERERERVRLQDVQLQMGGENKERAREREREREQEVWSEGVTAGSVITASEACLWLPVRQNRLQQPLSPYYSAQRRQEGVPALAFSSSSLISSSSSPPPFPPFPPSCISSKALCVSRHES